MTSNIRYEIVNAVAEITLDRPPVNALDPQTVNDLLHALEMSAFEECFCAGLDLAAVVRMEPPEIRDLLEALYPRLTQAQLELGKPSIAAVRGAARGGGMTLAISCDLIVAGRGASFGYPEIEIGVLPAIHFAHLHRIVGRYRAFDLLFTGSSIEAREAHALGLVSRLVEDGEVITEARALAQRLAAKAPAAMRKGREAFYAAADSGYQASVAAAVDTFCNVASAPEAREGMEAFLQKRAPRWRR